MDFGIIQLTDEQQKFKDEISTLLDQRVAERGPERRRFGLDETFDPVLQRAIAERGLTKASWPVEDGGAGLDPVRQYILDYELRRRGMEDDAGSQTDFGWQAVKNFGQPDLVAELKPLIASGQVRFCLGYTEPEGGSDIAACKTRAVRDGDEWVINGAKMYTTGAHLTQYIFLITRTDTDAPKHKSLTMFLVPVDTPGVEVHPLQTVGDERTNITYYGNVRLPDRYRIGGVNEGWKVLHGPLDAEHNLGQESNGFIESSGAARLRRAPVHAAFDAAVEWARTSVRPDGSHPIDDPTVRVRLARVAADIELTTCTHGLFGRVAGAETNVRTGAELTDIVGAEALLPYGADGAIDGGDIERLHRFAQPSLTYGGSVEVTRQLIAQHVLGLPRPQYPGSKYFVSDSGGQQKRQQS